LDQAYGTPIGTRSPAGALRGRRPPGFYGLGVVVTFGGLGTDLPVVLLAVALGLAGLLTGLGVTRLLESIRQIDPGIRFFQASSSEMFGKVREVPQTESTPFHPPAPTVDFASLILMMVDADLARYRSRDAPPV
jgi:hypothetical protein